MSRHRGGTAATPATTALKRLGISFEVMTYEHDPATTHFGAEAAQLLDFPADRVLKTLLVSTDTGLAVGVVPVTGSLDLKAMARELHAKKAEMCEPRLAERTTGYIVGGISPIGQKKALPTLIDASVADTPTVLVSGGRRGFDVALAPADLAAATGGRFAAIARATAPRS